MKQMIESEDGFSNYIMYAGARVYLNGNNNKPYTKEDKMWAELRPHLSNNLRSLKDEYNLVLQKKSKLSSRLRGYVKHLMEEKI